MQLVLNTHGLSLKVKDGRFRVSGKEQVRDISPEQISSIAITSPCLLSSAAVRLAAESEIPIYFFDRFGDADACLRSPYFESLATLRRKQVYFSDRREGTAWVVLQFSRKTAGQIDVFKALRRKRRALHVEVDERILEFNRETDLLKKRIQRPTEKWAATIMGWEGQLARKYWALLSKALPEDWQFAGRSRRPAQDPFNSAINYFYGMLYAQVEQALFGAGLDPHLGILHADEYDRPTLAYDLIEGFRPWVDLFVIESIYEHQENLIECFEAVEGGWWLGKAGKRLLIPAYNEWMRKPVRWEGRQMRRIAHIHRAAAELAKTIDLTMKRPV